MGPVSTEPPEQQHGPSSSSRCDLHHEEAASSAVRKPWSRVRRVVHSSQQARLKDTATATAGLEPSDAELDFTDLLKKPSPTTSPIASSPSLRQKQMIPMSNSHRLKLSPSPIHL